MATYSYGFSRALYFMAAKKKIIRLPLLPKHRPEKNGRPQPSTSKLRIFVSRLLLQASRSLASQEGSKKNAKLIFQDSTPGDFMKGWKNNNTECFLVGGWTNPFEKY